MILYACIGGVCCVGVVLAALIAYELGNKKGYALGYSRGLDHAQTIAVVLAKDQAAKEGRRG